MRACIFIADRKGAEDILAHLMDRGHEIVCCVIEKDCNNGLFEFCKKNDIPITSYNEVKANLDKGIIIKCDYAFSFLYHKIIKKDVIDMFDGNIINFHPSLVEIHKGIGSYCYCLLNEYRRWGCTAHFLAEGIDEGDIILQREYDVPDRCYGYELEGIQNRELIELFKDVITIIEDNKGIPRIKQDTSKGVYFSQKDLDKEKQISLDDKSDNIDKKIRALWRPPYTGAYIVLDGKKYSLVSEELLEKLSLQ